MIPEEDDAPHGDLSAERRARRAWLGDAALLRRAEAAEASVRTLENQLAERELELRRVKQREYAEQQLRVEAEETAMRARRGRRDELDRWQRRIDTAHAATLRVEAQRDSLAARLAAVNASAVRLGAGIESLHSVATELRHNFEHDHAAAQARIRQLEAQLEARPAPPAAPQRADVQEAQRREEMASALAAAVTRLRSRAAATDLGQETLVAGEHPRFAWPPTAPAEPSAAVSATAPSGPVPATESTGPVPATESTASAPAADSALGASEVPTVIVVPRLFAGDRRSGRRLAPVARRVAARLTRWADRAQGRAR